MNNNFVTQNNNLKTLASNLLNNAPDILTLLNNDEKLFTNFKSAFILTLTKNPAIANTDNLISCIIACAKDGLLPDGKEACLLPFNESKNINGKWEKIPKVQYIPMYQGLLKKIYRTDNIKDINVNLVYENEKFKIIRKSDYVDIEHEVFFGDKGKLIGGYIVVNYTNGGQQFEFMRTLEFDLIRDRKKDKNGNVMLNQVWNTDYEEMCKKTLIRRIAKRMNINIDLPYEPDIDTDNDIIDLTIKKTPLQLAKERRLMLMNKHNDENKQELINFLKLNKNDLEKITYGDTNFYLYTKNKLNILNEQECAEAKQFLLNKLMSSENTNENIPTN